MAATNTSFEQEHLGNEAGFVDVRVETIRSNFDHYRHFMDHYGPKLIGEAEFKKQCTTKTPDEWLTTAEESFGLVSMENYRDMMRARVQNSAKVPAKYTVVGKAKRNMGFSEAGIDRYSMIYNKVKADRKFCTKGEQYRKLKQEEAKQRVRAKQLKQEETIRDRENGRKAAACDEFPI